MKILRNRISKFILYDEFLAKLRISRPTQRITAKVLSKSYAMRSFDNRHCGILSDKDDEFFRSIGPFPKKKITNINLYKI